MAETERNEHTGPPPGRCYAILLFLFSLLALIAVGLITVGWCSLFEVKVLNKPRWNYDDYEDYDAPEAEEEPAGIGLWKVGGGLCFSGDPPYIPWAVGILEMECVPWPDEAKDTFDGNWKLARASSVLSIITGSLSCLFALLLASSYKDHPHRHNPLLRAIAITAMLSGVFGSWVFVGLHSDQCKSGSTVHISAEGGSPYYFVEFDIVRGCELHHQSKGLIAAVVLWFLLSFASFYWAGRLYCKEAAITDNVVEEDSENPAPIEK